MEKVWEHQCKKRTLPSPSFKSDPISFYKPQNQENCTMVYSNKMLLLSFSDSVHVSHDTSISFVWRYWPTASFLVGLVSYSSLSLFTSICASLHLPFALFSLASFPPCPLSFGALAPCSECIWRDLYNGFTALCALRGITGIPEYFPASLKSMFFVFFPLYPPLLPWCIHLPFHGCLPPLAVWSTLCNVRNTSPSAALHCSKSVWCAVHTVSSSVFWNLGQLYYLLIAFSQLP